MSIVFNKEHNGCVEEAKMSNGILSVVIRSIREYPLLREPTQEELDDATPFWELSNGDDPLINPTNYLESEIESVHEILKYEITKKIEREI